MFELVIVPIFWIFFCTPIYIFGVYYKNPQSYTGEDLLEIQTHGNPIILGKIMNILCPKYARQARAGEFTERAFLNSEYIEYFFSEFQMMSLGLKL